MLTQRLLLLCAAGACSVLLGVAGCSKSSSTSGGGGSTSGPSNQEDATALELAAAKQVSINNLKQMALAIHAYHDTFGRFPAAGHTIDKSKVPPPNSMDAASWRVQLLPYIEQAALWNQIQTHPQAEIPESVASTAIRTFVNPMQKKNPTTKTNYRVFVGGGSIFEPNGRVTMNQVADGTSNTILIVEAAEAVDWSKPEDLMIDGNKPLPKLGIFPGGFHAAMADGSIRWIPSDTPEHVIRAMITRAAGEAIQLPGKEVARRPNGQTEPEPEPPAPEPKFTENPPGKKLDVTAIRTAAARQVSRNNLAQIGLAMLSHEAATGRFPSPGLLKDMPAPKNFASPHSWRVSILPYIEQDNLWKLIPANGMGPLPKEVSSAVVKVYVSPLTYEPKAQANYRVFVGNGAAFERGQTLKIADFTDGLSNTIFAVESADPIDWTSTDDFDYDPNKPLPKLGIFAGGFHALMGDGTVQWIPSSTDEKTIRAMITRNGGETIMLPGSK